MGPDQVKRRDATSLAQEKRLPQNRQFRTASQFTLVATHAAIVACECTWPKSLFGQLFLPVACSPA